MTIQVMFAHLGLLEPGTAAIDRDGDVWCVWPSGHGGLQNPNISPDLLQATAIWGPFAVIGTGLPSTICDACGRAAQDGNPAQAKSIVLEHQGKRQPEGPCWAELGVESIDGPNGLRRFARLVGGRLGPDGQPEQRCCACGGVVTINRGCSCRADEGGLT